MDHLTPSQVAAMLAETAVDPSRVSPLLLDVREPWEFETARIEGATLIPMSNIGSRVAEVEGLQEAADGSSRPIVCICHHGARSMQVAAFLEQQGLQQVVNMTGGIHAWSLQVDPGVPTY
ncbi:MAG: sulfurtransferase [Herminiimonas sp.]|nr:sulfurtransferase [Herminiimonas sp.]